MLIILTMEMVGTADVVAWNDGDESSSSIGAGGLETTERVTLQRSVGPVSVALGLDAGVYTGGVAAPELDISICHGLAA
jgi:hypothetical protein